LDNNLVERALKKAIVHRKNALFYKTANGAQVGDLFMSLIYTCELEASARSSTSSSSSGVPTRCRRRRARGCRGPTARRCSRAGRRSIPAK
jgi:hypothetical protein